MVWLGLVVFVIAPALEKNSWRHARLFGALFGLITYATYALCWQPQTAMHRAAGP